MKRIVLAFIGCVVFPLVLQSCSKEIVDPGPTPTGITVPKKGSWFTFHKVAKDSNDIVREASYNTYTFIETGLNKFGRSPVAMVEVSTQDDLDTFYYHYDQNGDIAVREEESTQWVVMPFGSKQTLTSADTFSYESSSGLVFSQTRDTVKYIGTGQQEVSGKTFHTVIIRSAYAVEQHIVSTNELFLSGSQFSEISFIPSLGFVSRIYRPHQIFEYDGSMMDEEEEILTSYELK